MTNVLVIGIVGAFIILIIAAYIQSKKTREELIAEMQEELLPKQAPVAKPALVEAKVKPTVATVKEIPAAVEALAAKAAVQEMVATQEAPVTKPKRKRPAKKKPTQN